MTTSSTIARSGPSRVQAIALDSVVTRLEAIEQQRRSNDAAHLQLLADAFDFAAAASTGATESSVPRGEPAELEYRAIRAELACALHVSERQIERHMNHAFLLTTLYHSTFLELSIGTINRQHTEVIVDAGAVIGVSDSPAEVFRRAAYEAAILPIACEETPNRLRPIARRLAEQYAESTLDERHERARTERRVCLTDQHDGMSELVAVLPTVEAHAIYDRLTRLSKELAQVELTQVELTNAQGELPAGPGLRRRTRDELRADVFSELLRAGATGTADETRTTEDNRAAEDNCAAKDNRAAKESRATLDAAGLAGVQAQVQILVTDQALFAGQLRLDDAAGDSFDAIDIDAPTSLPPAETNGRAPIDSATARLLAATASAWQLIRQDPNTNEILSVDRYRPSAQMRRLLGARDLHCRFPGCRAPVHRCDLDHTVDAAKGGPTSTTNLAYLCRGHHMLKHHGGWRVTQHEGGVLRWRTPTGRTYLDRPPSRVAFGVAHDTSRSVARGTSRSVARGADRDMTGVAARGSGSNADRSPPY